MRGAREGKGRARASPRSWWRPEARGARPLWTTHARRGARASRRGRAGADIIDCCVDSFSGLTSQPSMGAIVNALRGTPLDTGVDPAAILPLSTYW